MIKMLLTAGTLFFSVCGFAQLKEGIILFESKMDMHKGVPERYKPMIERFRTNTHQLLFNDSVSLFKEVVQDEVPDPFEDKAAKSRNISTSSINYNTQTYVRHKQKSVIESKELDGKPYLIHKTVPTHEWKLTNETREILGYQCKKATLVEKAKPGIGWTFRSNDNEPAPPKPTTVEVVAWYTEAIPASVGPEEYGQLPGAILLLDIDNGTTIYTARQIKKSLAKSELKEPKKGKAVTEEEFVDMRKKVMGGERKVKM